LLSLLSLCVAATAGFLRNANVSTKGTMILKHVIQSHAMVQGFVDGSTHITQF